MPVEPAANAEPKPKRLFKIQIGRSAKHLGAELETMQTFLDGLVRSYELTETGQGILRLLHKRTKPIAIRPGWLAVRGGFWKAAPVFDFLHRIKVGGMAIWGSIYLPADFHLRIRRSPLYTRLLVTHELIHILYRHDFPRMTQATEAWAYWHEYKLFCEWREGGQVLENLPIPGGAKRGKKINEALEKDQERNPDSPFWKPELVKHLVGSSYDWYVGYGRVRKFFLRIGSIFNRD